MKILVTGAAGFIGFHLVRRLVSEQHQVFGLDNINDYYDINLKYARLAETGIYSPEETDRGGGKNKKYPEISSGMPIQSSDFSNYRFLRIDLEEKQAIADLFASEHFDLVINLAAQAGIRYSIENPEAYIRSNVVGFFNVLEACRHHNVKRLIYASSSSIYGENAKVPFSENDQADQPISLYAATKKSNELMAHTYSHLYGIKTTGLRFFTVYGPWGRPDMAPMLFAHAIRQDQPIKVFNNGKMARDFTYVDDIVEGIVKLAKQETAEATTSQHRIFNIGNGSPVNLLDFIETLEKSFDKKVEKIMMPMQDGDVPQTWADTTNLTEVTGFKPQTSIADGIAAFGSWFQNFYK